jgi:hypothetical protein
VKHRKLEQNNSSGRPVIIWKCTQYLKLELNFVTLVRLSAKLVPTFADRACRVVSTTDPYCRIFDFLDRSRYVFFQVAPQLYSRGWEEPVSDPLLLRKCGSAGNRTQTSGSGARNSDHQTTEAACLTNGYRELQPPLRSCPPCSSLSWGNPWCTHYCLTTKG